MPSGKIAALVVADMSSAKETISMLATQNRKAIMDGSSHSISGTDITDCGLFVWANTSDVGFDAMFDQPEHGSILSRLQFDALSAENLRSYVDSGALNCVQVRSTNPVLQASNTSSALQVVNDHLSKMDLAGIKDECVEHCVYMGDYPYDCDCEGFEPSGFDMTYPFRNAYNPVDGWGFCRTSTGAGSDCMKTGDCLEIYVDQGDIDACAAGCDLDRNCRAFAFNWAKSRDYDKCFVYWGPAKYGCLEVDSRTECFTKSANFCS